VNWTSRTSGTTNWLTRVTYGNGTFVAVGDNGTILTSGDGVNWTSHWSGTSNLLISASYSNGTYVAAGNFGTILKSEYTADAGNNGIIVGSSVVTEGSSVTLTAYGDRQSAAVAAIGDERYVPTGWSSTESGQSGVFTLSGGSYTSTYTPAAADPNGYTVTATFTKQMWNGSEWADTATTDTKTVIWVEVGGEVNGNTITVKVNHFTKYAVLAVGEASDAAAGTKTTAHFSDIAGHWAEASIKQAVDAGIVSGYPDGSFRPDRTVTRAEFTVMLMNALRPQGNGSTLTFTDTAKIGAWAQQSVAQAVYAKIIGGYEDGSFRPDAEITRPEMASMIAKALGQSVDAAAVTGFADDENIPDWTKTCERSLPRQLLSLFSTVHCI
jgi:hypothetical protein